MEYARKVGYGIRVWCAAVPRILNNLTLGVITHPRTALAFHNQVLNWFDLTFPDLVLGSKSPSDLFPATGDIAIVGPYYDQSSGGTSALMELATLAAAAKCLRPGVIFEIGTFMGRTGRIMLLNGGEDSRLFTLDLPADQCAHVPGKDLRGTPEETRATFLSGDSMNFDFSPWYGQCDLVWVDACHDYEYVVSDTENALKMVTPGGWVLWHDYRHTAWWSGVTKCLQELKSTYPSLCHVTGTAIAALHMSEEQSVPIKCP